MNTQNDIARENARRTDGKFGSYQLPDAGTDLDLDMDTPAITPPGRPQWVVAEPAPEGYVDLYHRTGPDAASDIYAQGRMMTRENTDEAYFSTSPDSEEASGYGEAVVMVRVPEGMIELDDEFPDGEQHYRVPLREITSDTLMSRCPQCSRWAGRTHSCT